MVQLKKRLGNAKGLWADSLPETLWAYKCTPQTTTGETLFNLTYEMYVMISVEIGEPTLCQELQYLKINEKCLKTELDLLKELRDKARIREETVKRRATIRYNAKVILRSFNKNNLVWRVRTKA